MELALYLGSAEAQKLHYKLRSVIPCSLSLSEDADVVSDPVYNAQNETFNETAILQPSVPSMANCWNPVESMGKLLRSGNVSHDNAKEETEKMNTSMNADGIK